MGSTFLTLQDTAEGASWGLGGRRGSILAWDRREQRGIILVSPTYQVQGIQGPI